MILGRVVGTVVATRKDERLLGAKLLLVRTTDPKGKDEPGYTVAVDTVLVVTGSSARMASGLKDSPVDAAIVGIVDTVEVQD
jgi:microcompartment protein CcmK/EutM